jgi:hypothetical protein
MYFLIPLAIIPPSCLAAPQTIINLATEGPQMGFRFKNSGQSGQTRELGGRPAFEVTWDGTQKPFCEFSFHSAKRPALPDFIQANIVMDVYIPENNRATLITLRILDRHNEVFQFQQNLPQNVTGWQQIIFPIDVSKPPPVRWGGKPANQKIDPPLKIYGVSVGYKDRQSTGTLGIGPVAVEVTRGIVQTKLETGNPIHVVRPGEEHLLAIKLINPGSWAANVKLEYTLVFAGGKDAPETFTRELALPSHGESQVKLPAPTKYGVYKLGIRLADERGKFAGKEVSYCYMPPAGPVPGRAKGFIFGISEHPQWYPRPEQELMAQAAAWAGIKVIRDGIDWSKMEPVKGQWKFESFDHFLEVFEKQDIELAPTYPGPLPKWATAADWKPARPVNRGRPRPDYGHWATFVRTFAGRYKGRIRFVETWNEPDLLSFANFTPEEYVKLMEIAYTETKKIDPGIQVQSGGFTAFKVNAANSPDPDFLEKSVRLGKDFYDIFAIHVHSSFGHYVTNITKLAELRASLGDTKPWWSNETAISAISVGEIGQAETLFRKFLYSWAYGAIGYNWYNLRNKGFDPKNNEHNFGLVTRDFYPKPAYATYNMLARYYREGEFVRGINIGPRLYGYLFKGKTGDYLLANWNGDSFTGDSRPVIVTNVTGQASAVDLWGNETPIQIANGTVVLPVTPRPSTLRISGQTNEPAFVGELFRIKERLTVLPGTKRDFAFTLNNPGSQNLAFSLNFTAPPGLQITPDRHTVIMPPKEVRDVVFNITANPMPATQARASRSGSVMLDMRIGDLWQGKLDYNVQIATCIQHGDFGRLPAFELNDQSQVTPLVLNEPSTAHLFWKGPDDLGAKVWLAEKDGKLKIKVIVTDDIHSQPFSGEAVWSGDNVQLGIDVPGQNLFWEIGLTHLASGASEVFVWQSPRGFSSQNVLKNLTLKTSRNETARQTIHEAEIPLDSIGLDRKTAKLGFGFNILLNDNDGATRESFMALNPGLGRDKTSENWPVVVFGQ